MALTVSHYRRDVFTVVELTGELQHATSSGAEAEIFGVLERSDGTPRIVLNLTAVTFLDSGGVNLLARANKRVLAGAGTLACVAAPGSRPDRVLTLTGFNQFMPVYRTLSEAFD